jgi:general secretion pathway protein D
VAPKGATIRFNLGEEIPILSTAFTPIAGGGSNVNPLTSYSYRPIGIIVEMIPRVTYQDEIALELKLENSSLGVPIDVAGAVDPPVHDQKVETKLRLREGESTLLAGLLQDEERTSATGFPGLQSLPIVRSLSETTATR